MAFVYRTIIKTTPERLWEALTDATFLRRFWFNCDVQVGNRVGEPFSIEYKGERMDEGEVVAYDPPRTLAYTFRHLKGGEPPSLVTFTLEPQGDLVRLTLVHDRFSEGSKLLPSVAGGWPAILSTLKSLLEGVELDFSRVELTDGPFDTPMQTVVQLLVAAAPERIWEAITRPEMTATYFFGRRVESDWQVGSPVRYLKPDGSVDVSGEVLRSEPPRLLSFTWRVEGMEHPRCWVTFEIEPFGPASRLTLREEHAEPLDARTLEGGRQGWPTILSGLKTLVETGRPLGLV